MVSTKEMELKAVNWTKYPKYPRNFTCEKVFYCCYKIEYIEVKNFENIIFIPEKQRKQTCSAVGRYVEIPA